MLFIYSFLNTKFTFYCILHEYFGKSMNFKRIIFIYLKIKRNLDNLLLLMKRKIKHKHLICIFITLNENVCFTVLQ